MHRSSIEVPRLRVALDLYMKCEDPLRAEAANRFLNTLS